MYDDIIASTSHPIPSHPISCLIYLICSLLSIFAETLRTRLCRLGDLLGDFLGVAHQTQLLPLQAEADLL
jgi:hypothetical protein